MGKECNGSGLSQPRTSAHTDATTLNYQISLNQSLQLYATVFITQILFICSCLSFPWKQLQQISYMVIIIHEEKHETA
jgi:hypothetical protein